MESPTHEVADLRKAGSLPSFCNGGMTLKNGGVRKGLLVEAHRSGLVLWSGIRISCEAIDDEQAWIRFPCNLSVLYLLILSILRSELC